MRDKILLMDTKAKTCYAYPYKFRHGVLVLSNLRSTQGTILMPVSYPWHIYQDYQVDPKEWPIAYMYSFEKVDWQILTEIAIDPRLALLYARSDDSLVQSYSRLVLRGVSLTVASWHAN